MEFTSFVFACNQGRHVVKLRKVLRLARKRQFLVLSEAHSLPGRADALRLPSDMMALWSDGSASTGGVGSDFEPRFPE